MNSRFFAKEKVNSGRQPELDLLKALCVVGMIFVHVLLDLGKDVAPEAIVKAAKEQNIRLVGLSALMTTTVVSMEETIKLLRKECPDTKVVVGGAVLTQEYADKIGADAYGKDAMASVRVAEEVFA